MNENFYNRFEELVNALEYERMETISRALTGLQYELRKIRKLLEKSYEEFKEESWQLAKNCSQHPTQQDPQNPLDPD
jgi:DNA-directed RNA polymerase alpha subunit